MSFKNRTPEQQATAAVKLIDGRGTPRHGNRDDDRAHSHATVEKWRATYASAARWMGEQHGQRLHHLTPAHARTYLEARSTEVQQKQLGTESRALEAFLRHRDRDSSVQVERVRSELDTATRARAYTGAQVAMIVERQSERMGLSTRIAEAAGLRAQELHTLQRIEERAPSAHRSWSDARFAGRETWSAYTVDGKGGLVREVRIPPALAAELEARRLDEPRQLVDRQTPLESHYDLSGGNSFSGHFSRDSRATLGWSQGAHGLRHSYAQARMAELRDCRYSYEAALGIVSQEMGHFRADITEVYLR